MAVIEMLGIASKSNSFAVVICLVTSVGYISGALVTYLLFIYFTFHSVGRVAQSI